MVAHSGLFVAPASGVGTSPTDGRLALAGIIGATPQTVQGGAVTQSSTTMAFTVAQAVLELPDPTNTAAAFVSPIDQTVLTPAAGPATGNRVDLIVAKQNNPENGDSDARASFSLIAGTAGAPGVAPAVPAGYFRYADINVPTGASNAAACTLTLRSPSTFAPVDLLVPSWALLQTITGANGQHATVTADATAGNNGDYLCLGGTTWVPEFLRIGASVKRSTAGAAFGSATWTQLTNTAYWTTDEPAAGMNAFNGTFVAPVAGVYDVRIGLQLDSTVNAILVLKKNDSGASSAGNIAASSASGMANFTALSVSKMIRLNAGDYVAGAIYCSAAATWNTAAPDASFFSIEWKESLR